MVQSADQGGTATDVAKDANVLVACDVIMLPETALSAHLALLYQRVLNVRPLCYIQGRSKKS